MKSFNLKEWRAQMGDKLGIKITHVKAAKLLCFADDSMIVKIETGRNKAQPQTIRLAELLLLQPETELLAKLDVCDNISTVATLDKK